jgi:hypothetical protein
VPILSLGSTKTSDGQTFRSKQNFTTVAAWKPDPIVIGEEGDAVTLWWGNY